MAIKRIKKIKNACAPVALCHASGRDEDTVMRVCISAGFSKKEGMADEEWQQAADDLGIVMRAVPLIPQRLQKFIRRYKEGLFLVYTHDHLFCVDGGIIYDPREKLRGKWPGLGRIVKGAWRVEPKI